LKIFPDFCAAIQAASDALQFRARPVHTETWQGFDISKRPEAEMREILGFDLRVAMPSESLEYYRAQILPNLPWADDHFAERVAGYANPGETWLSWPWALKADSSRKHQGEFSHTYMTRYWPRFVPPEGGRVINTIGLGEVANSTLFEMRGHKFRYGDLADLVNLLAREPHTRQAWLPIFFPEDTGAVDGQRVPCTLGYYFIQRNGFLHLYYPIRSCDFYRHFRDDLYLTVRLTLWVLERLRERDVFWQGVRPGFFDMWVGSFHLFVNDWTKLFAEKR
jgi:hypothetical protein